MAAAVDGWLLASQEFVERIKRLVKRPQHVDEVPSARRLASASLADALRIAAVHFGVDKAIFAQKHSKLLARDIAAWLATKTTVATLRELAAPFGLTHPDSVRNLLARADAAMPCAPIS